MREAFEKALADDPYDQLSHLAFADWLNENGLDDEAEFHRLWTSEWQQAKDYLVGIAHDHDVDFEEMIAELRANRSYCQQNATSMQWSISTDHFTKQWDIYNHNKYPLEVRDGALFTCSC